MPHEKINWTDDQLKKIVRIINKFHDATQGSPLAGLEQVVCHNDLAPWNLVLNENNPVAFIDYDDAAPGSRVDDLGYFLWTFLELGNPVPVDVQAKKIKTLSDAYGFHDGGVLLDAIYRQQQKILARRERLVKAAADEESRQFSEGKIVSIRSNMQWLIANREILEQDI